MPVLAFEPPQRDAVLARCEWGKDDYSLNIQNLPPPEPPGTGEAGTATDPGPGTPPKPTGRGRGKKPKEPGATPLFDVPFRLSYRSVCRLRLSHDRALTCFR